VCLPKDTVGFIGFLEEQGLGELAPLLRAVIRVNDEMGMVAAPADGAPAPPVGELTPPNGQYDVVSGLVSDGGMVGP
jgi:hypothetical protein